MDDPTAKSTNFSDYGSIPCGDNMLQLHEPVVMGVINLTPDSFYSGSRFSSEKEILTKVSQMLDEGASIIDLGAVSTRPGSLPTPESEEIGRLIPALKSLKKEFPRAIFSIDTFRSSVVKLSFDEGAGIINDISGGKFDDQLLPTAVTTGLPYILMHMQGTPGSMQVKPYYSDVMTEVKEFMAQKVSFLFKSGIKHIFIDPGFGFGKTIEHNYELLRRLCEFNEFNLPILVGISRKSMIYKLLKVSPEESLHGTAVLNAIALQNGAGILRVHDVKEAVQTLKLVKALRGSAE